MKKSRRIELLAPARNADIAMAAIEHGADAVYMGAGHHGARAAAGNSVADIARVVEMAHRFDARVYVTLNTLIYDDEIEGVESLVKELYSVGADALIVQDMGLLKMDLPPIALHASTQCDIRTPEKARFLEDAGFSQLVLARELTLTEISKIREATTVPLEGFVHGALCVSYSGNCQASYALTGRSGNRGECAQICRLAYDLIDGDGRKVTGGKHLLSLRDMNRIASMGEMIEAGISSFKIEGRLKDMTYVKTVTAAYRQALDRIIDASDGALRRGSTGRTAFTFAPDLTSSFNRGYTEYFLHERRPDEKMGSTDSPKSVGEPVGSVISTSGKVVEARLTKEINNGDGLCYYDKSGKLQGFRVNRAEGRRLYPATVAGVEPGTKLYRNSNAKIETAMLKATAERRIDVKMRLRKVGERGLALDIMMADEPLKEATAMVERELQPAQKPQSEAHRGALEKLGDTVYRAVETVDEAKDCFVPVSVITSLRRSAVEALDRCRRATYPMEYRRLTTGKPTLWKPSLDYSDNVANRLAREYYEEIGAKTVEGALESMKNLPERRLRVMQTRYCLRRELGACLRTPEGRKLKEPLSLRGINFELRPEFDCANCEMKIYLGKRR